MTKMFLIAVAFGMFALGVIGDYFKLLPRRVMQLAEYAAFGKPLIESADWTNKTKLFDRDAKGASIVMLGDSLTAYANWNVLLQRLDVLNYGIEGDVSAGLLQRVEDSNLHGKTIFIMIGLNDISNHGPVNKINDNVLKIVSKLGADNTVYLQSTLMTRSGALNAQIGELNDVGKRTCSVNKCRFIDLNS